MHVSSDGASMCASTCRGRWFTFDIQIQDSVTVTVTLTVTVAVPVAVIVTGAFLSHIVILLESISDAEKLRMKK
jgi:hypothetical protein